MDFSCEAKFTLLKLCDYDARFASCIYVLVKGTLKHVIDWHYLLSVWNKMDN